MSRACEEDWTELAMAHPGAAFPRIFDSFDEVALEMALRFRDECLKSGENARLHALTVSDIADDRLYEKLFALGYASVVRLDCNTGSLCTPNVKAALIASRIRETELPDVIFCGEMGGIGGSRMTGPMLAEQLGLPCINNVSDVGYLRGMPDIRTTCAGTCSRLSISGKAVLLAGNSEHGLLRVPTIKARLAARGMKAVVIAVSPVWSLAEIRPVTLFRQQAGQNCRFIEGTAAEQAEAIANIFKGGGP